MQILHSGVILVNGFKKILLPADVKLTYWLPVNSK